MEVGQQIQPNSGNNQLPTSTSTDNKQPDFLGLF